MSYHKCDNLHKKICGNDSRGAPRTATQPPTWSSSSGTLAATFSIVIGWGAGTTPSPAQLLSLRLLKSNEQQTVEFGPQEREMEGEPSGRRWHSTPSWALLPLPPPPLLALARWALLTLGTASPPSLSSRPPLPSPGSGLPWPLHACLHSNSSARLRANMCRTWQQRWGRHTPSGRGSSEASEPTESWKGCNAPVLQKASKTQAVTPATCESASKQGKPSAGNACQAYTQLYLPT